MKVLVIGAGIIGSAIARWAARAGVEVVVLDGAGAASGTTSRGEGNILLSDKAPGLELDLARLSRTLWDDLGEDLGRERFELQDKGGLVVPTSPEATAALDAFATSQRVAGVQARSVEDVHDLEPYLAPDLASGMHYPEDAQVQPVLAAHALLADAGAAGARVFLGDPVIGGTLSGPGVRTASGAVHRADAVVNAAGTWGGAVGRLLGAPVAVLPRRGFILVTEPCPPIITHKVYSADYVANVASSDAGLETSCVVESTPGGTILIGASRERVGFELALRVEVVERLAAQAVRFYPVLAGRQLLRVYRGFRPYCPDHLPVIGPDPRLPWLLHACGHEGAGIGLATGTAALVTAYLTGDDPGLVDAFAGLKPNRLLTEEAS